MWPKGTSDGYMRSFKVVRHLGPGRAEEPSFVCPRGRSVFGPDLGPEERRGTCPQRQVEYVHSTTFCQHQ